MSSSFDMDVTAGNYLLMRNFDNSSSNIEWAGGSDLTTDQKEQISNGNYGVVSSVKVMDDGSITITTDLGVLTVTGGPELEEAKAELISSGHIETSLTEEADQIDRLYAMMKLIMGILAQVNKMSFDGAMQSAFLSYDQKLEQAQDMRNAAIFQFAFALTASVVTMAGAGIGLGAARGTGATAGQKSMAWQMGAQGLSQGINAIGQFGATLFQAEATEHEAESQKQEAFREAWNQLRQNLQSAIEKVLQTVTSFTQAQTQTNGQLLG